MNRIVFSAQANRLTVGDDTSARLYASDGADLGSIPSSQLRRLFSQCTDVVVRTDMTREEALVLLGKARDIDIATRLFLTILDKEADQQVRVRATLELEKRLQVDHVRDSIGQRVESLAPDLVEQLDAETLRHTGDRVATLIGLLSPSNSSNDADPAVSPTVAPPANNNSARPTSGGSRTDLSIAARSSRDPLENSGSGAAAITFGGARDGTIRYPHYFKGWTASFPSMKRAFDVSLASFGLALLAPAILVIATGIWATDRHGVLFRSYRVGRDGRRFVRLRFRTMRVDSSEILAGHFAEHPEAVAEWQATRRLRRDPRVTPIGSFLKKTGLDETPELVNVLRGDMSIVGPRPKTIDEISQLGNEAGSYFKVRPGMTGLWKTSGATLSNRAQSSAQDNWYVHSASMFLDLKIILKTLITSRSDRDGF